MLAHSLDFDVARERFMGQGDEEVHKVSATDINKHGKRMLQQQPFLVERNVLDVVINLIKKLMQSFVLEPAESSRIDWEGAQNFVYLVKTLRHANATELREMERRLLGEDVEQKERREKNKPRDLPKGSEWLKVSHFCSAAIHNHDLPIKEPRRDRRADVGGRLCSRCH